MKKILLLSLTLFSFACTKKQARSQAGGTLKIGVSQEFEILNPVISQMATSSYIFTMATGALTTIGEDWKWRCVLCTELPTFENKMVKKLPGGKLLVNWEILPNAQWGDGTPLTGNDVKFSWMVGQHPNVSVGQRDTYSRVIALEVDKDNPKKFSMTFKESRYDYYQLGTFYILPKHLEEPIFEKTKNQASSYEKQTLYNTDPGNPGLYFGPYVVKEIKLGSHIVLVKNPKYFGEAPKINQIVVKYVANTQALEANLLSGEIDMISEMGLFFDQLLGLEKKFRDNTELGSKYRISLKQGTIYEHITFNFKDPIVKDKKVRQALAYGLDREKMVKALFDGRQEVALHNIHPLDPYYTDNVKRYSYDLNKAQQLLEEAGWKVNPSDGMRYKDKKPLELTLMTTAQNQLRERIQVYVQAEWKKLGVEVKIKNEPARVFFGETVRKGTFPNLAMFAWVSSPDNPPQSTMHSKEIPTAKNGYSGQNSGGYVNAEADALLDKIPLEFNFDKRKLMVQRLQEIYAEELPALPLNLRADFAIVPSKMTGYETTGHQFYSTQYSWRWNY
ncbi:MAG: peptide ABC transporter substrate-binding protein [Proteobacteria bacterium]|nr:peptide ABC transporter substrate-binding protein [Pseudomonadota bacterium]